MTDVFIDGQAGTTGLQIRERLASREDVNLIEIPEQSRKDPEVRRRYLNEADVVILCLPDDAAREALRLISSNHVRVLDASTAHRVADGWVYGLPEVDAGQRERIRGAARVSNPGCYPTGFVLLVRPLVDAGIVPGDARLSCHAVSGYSGGGRRLIERYEARSAERPDALWNVRPYGLDLDHKHLPEMARYSGIDRAPVFSPMVGHFEQGMLTMIPLHTDTLGEGATAGTVHACLEARYRDEPCVEVLPPGDEDALDAGFLDPLARQRDEPDRSVRLRERRPGPARRAPRQPGKGGVGRGGAEPEHHDRRRGALRAGAPTGGRSAAFVSGQGDD